MNGRYERQIGFVILHKPIKSRESSVSVKVGYAQSRVWFRACHLEPEMTTEVPGPFPEASVPARPLFNVAGARIVIIGCDLDNNGDYIGEYGLIIRCPYPLAWEQACVQIVGGENHEGHIRYFASSSLCRSFST